MKVSNTALRVLKYIKKNGAQEPKVISNVLRIDEEGVQDALDELATREFIKNSPTGTYVIISEGGNGFLDGLEQKPETIADKQAELLIKEALSRDAPKWQGLGAGVHNDYMYYGINVFVNGTLFDAVVTSNCEIYVDWSKGGRIKEQSNDIRDDFGLHYRFGFFGDVLNHQWSNKHVKNFLFGDFKSKPPKTEDLFKRIVDLNKEYVIHLDERNHKYVALDIMCTYVLQIFETKGRTFFEADPGSGKTRQSRIYGLLSFNALEGSDISPASYYRTVESTKATVIIDDFDSIEDDKKSPLMQHYKTGYKKGAKAVRSEGMTNRPTGFDSFTHCVINNTLGLDRIALERTETIRMLKHEGDDVKEITDKKLNEKSPKWRELRDDLYLWGMCHYEEVKKAYEASNIKEFTGRPLEKVEPILVIAKLISDELYDSMIDLITDRNLHESTEDFLNDWEFNVMKFLHEEVTEPKYITNKEIVDAIVPICLEIDEEHRDYKKRRMGLERWVGRFIKRNPEFKASLSGGRTRYHITPQSLNKYIKVRPYAPVFTLTPTLQTHHTLQTLQTHQHSTNSTKNKGSEKNTNQDERVELVEKVEFGELDLSKAPQKERLTELFKYINQIEKDTDALIDKKELADFYQLHNLSIDCLESDLRTLKDDGGIYEPKTDRYKVA